MGGAIVKEQTGDLGSPQSKSGNKGSTWFSRRRRASSSAARQALSIRRRYGAQTHEFIERSGAANLREIMAVPAACKYFKQFIVEDCSSEEERRRSISTMLFWLDVNEFSQEFESGGDDFRSDPTVSESKETDFITQLNVQRATSIRRTYLESGCPMPTFLSLGRSLFCIDLLPDPAIPTVDMYQPLQQFAFEMLENRFLSRFALSRHFVTMQTEMARNAPGDGNAANGTGATSSADALQELLSQKFMVVAFKRFLEARLANELLLFYLEVAEYRATPVSGFQMSQGRKIYNKFLRTGAPQEVNISADVRSRISYDALCPSSFDEAQTVVLNLLSVNFFRQFLASEEYAEAMAAAEAEKAQRSESALSVLSITDVLSGPARSLFNTWVTTFGSWTDMAYFRAWNDISAYKELAQHVQLDHGGAAEESRNNATSRSAKSLVSSASRLYDKYVRAGGRLCLGVDPELKWELLSKLSSPTEGMFDPILQTAVTYLSTTAIDQFRESDLGIEAASFSAETQAQSASRTVSQRRLTSHRGGQAATSTMLITLHHILQNDMACATLRSWLRTPHAIAALDCWQAAQEYFSVPDAGYQRLIGRKIISLHVVRGCNAPVPITDEITARLLEVKESENFLPSTFIPLEKHLYHWLDEHCFEEFAASAGFAPIAQQFMSSTKPKVPTIFESSAPSKQNTAGFSDANALQAILHDPPTRHAFVRHLVAVSPEAANAVDLWQEVDALRSIPSSLYLKHLSRKVYNRFLAPGARQFVRLPDTISLSPTMENISTAVFAGIQTYLVGQISPSLIASFRASDEYSEMQDTYHTAALSDAGAAFSCTSQNRSFGTPGGSIVPQQYRWSVGKTDRARFARLEIRPLE